MRQPTPRLVAFVLGCSLLQAACYDWTAIKPTELPKLTGSGQRVVEREDGRPFEVRGSFNVRVSTTAGSTKFSDPVHSQQRDDRLIVDSVDQPPQSFSLQQPVLVEVSHLERGNTAVAVIWAVFGATVVVLFLNYAKSPGP